MIDAQAIFSPCSQWPIRHGIIEDWDLMERFMEQIIFKYLRAEPEDHYFLLVRSETRTPRVSKVVKQRPSEKGLVMWILTWNKLIFHISLQTEPPLNTPENREYTAEIMFESFNVPGLYIAVQVSFSQPLHSLKLTVATNQIVKPSLFLINGKSLKSTYYISKLWNLEIGWNYQSKKSPLPVEQIFYTCMHWLLIFHIFWIHGIPSKPNLFLR